MLQVSQGGRPWGRRARLAEFASHVFSFGHYHDPKQQGFSDLLVINDDRVAPRGGFRQASAPRHGNLLVRARRRARAQGHDGHGLGDPSGDVQMMSAGTGVAHSEYNASQSEPVHFLQIWLMPATKGVEPRYQQQHFTEADKRGRLVKIHLARRRRRFARCVPGRARVCGSVRWCGKRDARTGRGSLCLCACRARRGHAQRDGARGRRRRAGAR